jgi:hypothetical protein
LNRRPAPKEIIMTSRILALICGILIGMVLHAAITSRTATSVPAGADAASASAPAQDSRCSTHAIKMPCLFDSGPPANRKQ